MINMAKLVEAAYQSDVSMPDDLKTFPKNWRDFEITKQVLAFQTRSIKLAKEAVSLLEGFFSWFTWRKDINIKNIEYKRLMMLRDLQKDAQIMMMF